MNLYSVFASIDGEVNYFGQGSLCVFIRLGGCNLRCSYCDTIYAQDLVADRPDSSIGRVLHKIEQYQNINKITITGGEPLLQKEDVANLCRELWAKKYNVTIETNGSILVEPWLYYGARFVVDWKLPSSGMTHEMAPDNFRFLNEKDFIKFVISDKADFEQALLVRKDLYFNSCQARFAFSPMLSNNRAEDRERVNQLVEWMKLNPIKGAILNVQLHKILALNESK